MILRFLLLILLFSFNASAGAPESYYASIKSDEANVRSGPSVKYPINWQYQKSGWPVKVTASFNQWSKISDINGEAGWIHESMITRKRRVVVQAENNGVQQIYRLPLNSSSLVMIAENGVVADLLECKKNWCKIEKDDLKGWILAKYLWGVDANEEYEK